MSSNSANGNADANSQSFVVQPKNHMPGDLCFMTFGSLSSMQKARLCIQTFRDFEIQSRKLQQQLDAANIITAPPLRLRGSKSTRSDVAALLEREQVIELPMDLYENPLDSVMNKAKDHSSEYAGYYGNCSTEQIKDFFGEYLPKYEEGSMKVEKIVTGIRNPNCIRSDAENNHEQLPPAVMDMDNTNAGNPLALYRELRAALKFLYGSTGEHNYSLHF